MTVLVTVTIPGDTDQFRAYVAEHGDEMVAISQAGKDAGALHHRFAIGDGEVVVFDEWDSAESFQGFFEGNEEIAALMRSAGASGPPVAAFYEAIETADQF
jgi:heme-degrading monooxygenase HmoA